MTFPRRKLSAGVVSAMGLGCMGMSIPRSAGLPDEEECMKVLTAAADEGINFWVTSDAYGPFNNERLIGRWFKETGRRSEIFLATKFGIKVQDTEPRMLVCSEPEYVKEACTGSLERLNTDYIDLYLQQRVDSNTPIEETVRAMVELKNKGKIRNLGLSECSARTLERAHKVHPIAAAEMEFSLFALDIESPETKFLETAKALGVKIIPYSPLGRGFLTGTIRSRDDLDEKDVRRIFPRFSEENFEGNLKLVEGLEVLAAEKDCTPSQLALAWVLAQGEDFIPIPGTKNIRYLQENAGAVNVKLSIEDETRIRTMIESVGGTKGARYPDAHLSMCFGDSPELSTN